MKKQNKINSSKRKIDVRRIIVIVVLILVLIALVLGFYFYFNNDSDVTLESGQDVKNYIEKVNTLVLDGVHGDRLQKKLNFEVDDELVMVGEASYQRSKPSNDIIKEYNLNEYVQEAKTLADTLEEKIKDNFNVEIKDQSKDGEYLVSSVNYRTFYYYAYISDLKGLQSEILSKIGITYSDSEDLDDETIANQYKAKVKAMQILNKHLDTYVNDDETLNFDLYLEAGKSSENSDQITWYLYNILGYNYVSFDAYDQSRVEEYAKEISNKNVLDL